MWLSGQQKRPAEQGEGQTGIVTMSEGETAVLLDSERRGLQVYSPAGYHWTPRVGQRVLVIQGRGEIPCVVGARQGSEYPGQVSIRAGGVAVQGNAVSVAAEGAVSIRGASVDLQGDVLVNGESLEMLIARVLAELMGGGTA